MAVSDANSWINTKLLDIVEDMALSPGISPSIKFKFDLLQQAQECDDQEFTNDDGTFAQYDIDDDKNICFRVWCVNRVAGKEFKGSLIGPTGHLERANVWSHSIGAFIYLVYGCVRIVAADGSASILSNRLATANAFAIVVMYVISSVYHVYSSSRFWSAFARLGDYFGIYLGICSSFLVDLSISSSNMRTIPVQAVSDVVMASVLLMSFFVVRRIALPFNQTRKNFFESRCSLGLARSLHSDLEHATLRSGAGIVLALSWILTVPGAVTTLEVDCAVAFVASHIIGTFVLILGMAVDNMFVFPDNIMKLKGGSNRQQCVCYDDRAGCGHGWLISAHTFWHILAIVATVCTSIGVEYVIQSSDVLYTNVNTT